MTTEGFKVAKKYHRYIFLALGFVTSFFSLGRYNVPLFILVWPFCYLYYIHHEPMKLISLPVVTVLLLFANMGRFKDQENYLEQGFKKDMESIALWWPEQFLPFVIEGLLYGVIDKWKTVLLYPILVSTFEFCFSFCKHSNNNKFAYSQFDNLVLAQMIGLFGLYSLSFFLALFSSLLDYIVDYWKKNKRIIHNSAFFYLGFACFFYIYGGICLLCNPENIQNDKIKIALTPGLENLYYTRDPDESHYDFIYDSTYIIDEYLRPKFELAEEVGAQILSLAEEAIPFLEGGVDAYEMEKEVTEATQELCKEFGIMISMGVDKMIYSSDDEDYIDAIEYWNGLFFIDDEGKVQKYWKHNIVPFMESEYTTSNDKIETFDTKYGKMANVICWDLNFAPFMNYVGTKHPDIVWGPSWDFFGIYDFQPQTTKFRAIENGYNIVKNTIDGIVVVFDYLGRKLIYYTGEQGGDYFLTSHIYTHGKSTLFSYLGIFWNWLYIVSIFIVIFVFPSFKAENLLYVKEDEPTEDSDVKVYPETDNNLNEN